MAASSVTVREQVRAAQVLPCAGGAGLPREALRRELAARASGPGARLALSGRPGSGRTWLARRLALDPALRGVPLVAASAAEDPLAAEPAVFLHRLLRRLGRRFAFPEPAPETLADQVEVLPLWLARAAARGVVLVLDDIDRLDEDLSGELPWLPGYVPPGGHLLVTLEPGPAAAGLAAAGWDVAALPELSTEEAARMAGIAPEAACAWPDGARIPGIARAVARGAAPAARAREAAHDWLEQVALRAPQAGQWLARLAATALGLARVETPHPPPEIAGLVRRRAGRWLPADPVLAGALASRRAPDAPSAGQPGEPIAAAWLAWRRGAAPQAAAVIADPQLLATADGESRVLLGCMARDPRLAEALGSDRPPDPDPFPGLAPARQVALLQGLARLRSALVGAAGVEALLRRSLALARRQLGTDSAATAQAAHRLGAWLRERGLDSEAETLLREALDIRERRLGAGHPDTLATLHHLAALLEARPDLEAAEACYRDALNRAEAAFGASDARLLPHLANLAAARRAAGRLEAAEAVHRQAAELAARALGEAHPGTASAYDNLAASRYAGGDYPQAVAWYRRALAVAETAFGVDSAAAAACLHNLGAALEAAESMREAETCYRRALDIRRRLHGPDHSDTASSQHNLAGVLEVTGRREDAEHLYRQALASWERIAGDSHPATATTRNNLADLLRESGRLDEAEALYQANLETWRGLYGEDHPHTLMTAVELARTRADRGETTQAEPLLRQTLPRLARVTGPDHSLYADALCALALLLRRTGRTPEGVDLLEHAYRGMVERAAVLGPAARNLRRHLDLLQGDGGQAVH